MRKEQSSLVGNNFVERQSNIRPHCPLQSKRHDIRRAFCSVSRRLGGLPVRLLEHATKPRGLQHEVEGPVCMDVLLVHQSP